MTVSFTNLSGTRENLDKTVRYQLQTNWTAANVSSVTPTFESDTEEADSMASQDSGSLNIVRIKLFGRERDSENGDFNGDGKHGWFFRVIIELQGESLSILTLMEDEVNRILWELAPNSATRLLKSDGASSEFSHFRDSEVTFNRVEPESEDNDYTPISQGELIAYYYKVKN